MACIWSYHWATLRDERGEEKAGHRVRSSIDMGCAERISHTEIQVNEAKF